MGRKLYVGNLPYETGETELQELFARAGTVETVKVMRDMATGRARGFAFVEMSTDDEAQKAITELNEISTRRGQSRRTRAVVVAGSAGVATHAAAVLSRAGKRCGNVGAGPTSCLDVQFAHER